MTTTTTRTVDLHRSDIRSATVSLHGVHSEQTETRGVEIVGVIEWSDGETQRLSYDFIPGWDIDHDHGGHDLDHPRWAKLLDNAVEWMIEIYSPPNDPA